MIFTSDIASDVSIRDSNNDFDQFRFYENSALLFS